MKNSHRTPVAVGLVLAAFLGAAGCTSNGELEMAENEFQDNEQDPFDSPEAVSHEDPMETEVTRESDEEAEKAEKAGEAAVEDTDDPSR